MHRELRKLLENATGISQYVIAIVLDIRGFTPFCQTVDSVDVATYVTKVYMKIIDNYFSNASFWKPTGDGLLLVIPYDEKSLEEVVNSTIKSCLKLLEDFGNLCKQETMINFPTPNKIGIGITRGSACCITSEQKVLDYSGKVLNLASRLMDIARPSGIVFDSSFGLDLLSVNTKQLFSKEDNVYIRGVAEEKPITAYYTKSYTIIADVYKQPIREPKWETVSDSILLEKFKLTKPNLIIPLKGKPLDKEKIVIKIAYNLMEGYERVNYLTVNTEEIDYVVKGKNYLLYFKTKPLTKVFESDGVKDGMEIRFNIDYPTK